MDNSLNFDGKIVLVVGGSSGIGNSIAQAFRRCGAIVHICGTRASAAEYADSPASDLDGLLYSQLDLSAPGAVDAWKAPFDTLDILVLSQGIALYKRKEFEAEAFQRVIDLNLVSVMRCATRFAPELTRNRGSLILVSSTAAFRSTKGNPAYNASKAGVLGLTRTLGEAWASQGLRVNGIAPGFVSTKLTAVTIDDPVRRTELLQNIPLGRLGTPEDIAGVALFLASPLASYVVGQTIIVDGGMLL